MSEEKSSYTLQELFDDLPITLVELGKRAGINEVTLARIRDGRPVRRDTANKLLNAFGTIYNRTLNVRNVTGINVMRNAREEDRESKKQERRKKESTP